MKINHSPIKNWHIESQHKRHCYIKLIIKPLRISGVKQWHKLLAIKPEDEAYQFWESYWPWNIFPVKHLNDFDLKPIEWIERFGRDPAAVIAAIYSWLDQCYNEVLFYSVKRKLNTDLELYCSPWIEHTDQGLRHFMSHLATLNINQNRNVFESLFLSENEDSVVPKIIQQLYPSFEDAFDSDVSDEEKYNTTRLLLHGLRRVVLLGLAIERIELKSFVQLISAIFEIVLDYIRRQSSPKVNELVGGDNPLDQVYQLWMNWLNALTGPTKQFFRLCGLQWIICEGESIAQSLRMIDRNSMIADRIMGLREHLIQTHHDRVITIELYMINEPIIFDSNVEFKLRIAS